jgi:hypothetical protein
MKQSQLAGMFAGDLLEALDTSNSRWYGRSSSKVCRQTILAARSTLVARLRASQTSP